ncbi:MBL fold metallo-hydrolase [Sedimentibacter sp. MB31-C6]|uniref:MBL fold metallo-hydrolase n=1 Tax=Sedimentibacter sp. MB31-C6 TaxID=3109366 RepID=UPI002DDD4FBD|nr:MBL fold metallo-hydrolase [Sedimentibacter sp. MB36-C1]WSI03950.1 MBL fold metallo-hydrolase [Sedimentibacter sp. MB36-C1]
MKAYYIYHSCFVVETENSFLIFDYFDDKRTPEDDFNFKEVLKDIFKSNKHLYVFSSHSHHDHFNRSILSWSSYKKETYYILSNDIKLYTEVKNIYTVGKDEITEINNLKISTFGSTDKGVSFLVEIDGHTIFHAGDLNWWKWSDDTPEEEKEMETAFKGIIKDILIKDVAIDIAFFPVDGRLKENYFCGGQYFIEVIKPRIFVPMHFWDNFNITSLFKKSQATTTTNIIELQHNNQIIIQ